MRCRVSARYPVLLLLLLGFATPASAILFYTFLPSNGAGMAAFAPPRVIDPAAVAVPPGFCVEPAVTGLTYPVAVFTDEKDLLYIVESGYSYGEDFVIPRLLRLEPTGRVTEIAKGEPVRSGPGRRSTRATSTCPRGSARRAGGSSGCPRTASRPCSWTGSRARGTTTRTNMFITSASVRACPLPPEKRGFLTSTSRRCPPAFVRLATVWPQAGPSDLPCRDPGSPSRGVGLLVYRGRFVTGRPSWEGGRQRRPPFC